jgi:hypothetical protein
VTFETITADNSQHITLSDPAGLAPTEALIIGQGSWAIIRAVLSYSKRHGITPQYSARPIMKGEI